MCEKRIRSIKRVGSHATRLREARRIQRMQRVAHHPTPTPTTPGPTAAQAAIHKAVQNRVILALTWKTMALMHKNKLIQQKIIDLQKETAEFVRTVMSNPENRKRFLQNLRQGGSQQQPGPVKVEPNNNNITKLEPDV